MQWVFLRFLGEFKLEIKLCFISCHFDIIEEMEKVRFCCHDTAVIRAFWLFTKVKPCNSSIIFDRLKRKSLL